MKSKNDLGRLLDHGPRRGSESNSKKRGFSAIGWRIFPFAAAALCLMTPACVPSAEIADPEWERFGTAAQPIDHTVWDALLVRYVQESPDGINRVDYAALKANDAATLKRYLASMQAIDITQFPRDEQFAYWVNLYNAATVDAIVANYPLNSIRDIGPLDLGPWKDKVLKVNGKELSLDDIEHGILRPIWKDVRVHYAVNCASLGCPNLAAKAFTGAQLEQMLEAAASDFINHQRGFARKGGRLVGSSIYDWYGSDWGNQDNILDHARKYANGKTLLLLASSSKIDEFEYDWTLNSTK